MKIFCLLLCSLLVFNGEAYRILAVLPFPARSHQIFNNGIMRTLAEAGHDVTVLAPMSFWDNPTPNYHFIKLNSSLSSLKRINFFELNSIFKNLRGLWKLGEDICDVTLSDPKLKPFMNAKGKFDLLMVENFVNECFMGFAHSLDLPMIQIVTYIGSSWITDSVGAPTPYSYVYEPFLDVEPEMTFFDRIKNTIFGIGIKIARNWIYLPRLDKLMRRNFEDPNMPYITEIENTRTSLLFLNNHESFSYAKPGMPNMVNVAGMHIEDSKPLPPNLQKFMDEAKHGVIFVSMGSNIRMKEMDYEKRAAFIKILSNLKQRVIWRWDDDLAIPKESKNIIFSSWLPQVDILAHPNLVAFGTHGGLMSTIEALDRGIPVVGFPIFADQSINMRRFQSKGLGLVLDYKNISEISLSWAFKEILKPKYMETTKKYSKIFNDRERTAKESIIWWVEYIIRHQGAKHLRSPAMDVLWFQYYLLDIICFFFIVFVFIYCLARTLIKSVKRFKGIKIKLKKIE